MKCSFPDCGEQDYDGQWRCAYGSLCPKRVGDRRGKMHKRQKITTRSMMVPPSAREAPKTQKRTKRRAYDAFAPTEKTRNHQNRRNGTQTDRTRRGKDGGFVPEAFP